MYNFFERTRFRYGFVRQHTLDAGANEGWTEAVCYYDDQEEFSRWMLSFAGQASIVAPESLKKQHQELLRECVGLLT